MVWLAMTSSVSITARMRQLYGFVTPAPAARIKRKVHLPYLVAGRPTVALAGQSGHRQSHGAATARRQQPRNGYPFQIVPFPFYSASASWQFAGFMTRGKWSRTHWRNGSVVLWVEMAKWAARHGPARARPDTARLGHGPFGPFNSRGTALVPEARPKHGTKPA
jgi:hypothetical protein